MGSRKARAGDTIAAISTPPGEGGIGVIRISGEKAKQVLLKIFKKSSPEAIRSHRLYRGTIHKAGSGAPVDDVMAAYMKAPNSYTGEDVAEISCHGGSAVMNTILQEAVGAGAALAGRGEFTKRAFLNGKIDLLQAEAIIDLIRAKTGRGASIAINQLQGRLSGPIRAAREEVLSLLAAIEASIDFPEDVKEPEPVSLSFKAQPIMDTLKGLLKTADAGQILRQGAIAAIIGMPNVGKSSLLNLFLGRERAIVTPHPGTTRDTVEEQANIGGLPVILIDTAGMRAPGNEPEALGVERAREAAGSAELLLIVLDASRELEEGDIRMLSEFGGRGALVVLNKIDVSDKGDCDRIEARAKQAAPEASCYRLSALLGSGLDSLEKGIYEALLRSGDSGSRDVAINQRHKQCLIRASEALGRAGLALAERAGASLAAIDLKEAASALGEATGEEVSEEVIERIFADFCVGK